MAKKKAARPAKKQPAKPKPTPTPTPTPRQKTLPGMQDRKIAALENAALKYADVRDERMGWTKKEVEAKKRVQDLMHDQGRQRYERGNIEIELVPENEHVRVRIRDREAPAVEEEPVDHPPEPVGEPESPEELPVTEPDPDEEYDSRVSDSGVKDGGSEF